MFPHKRIKVSIAFFSPEVFASEQSKGKDNLQKPLLVINSILQAIKSGDSPENIAELLFVHLRVMVSGSRDIVFQNADLLWRYFRLGMSIFLSHLSKA